MNHEPHLPSDPCAHFIELATALVGHKRWFQSWTVLRYATVGLLTIPREPKALAEDLYSAAEEFKEISKWTSGLRGDVRFCIAAGLMRHGFDVPTFYDTLEKTRELFRKAGLPRCEVRESLACLVLMSHAPESRPTPEQVGRVAEVYAGMKKQLKAYTGVDDLPAAALIATSDDDLDRIQERLESLYKGLKGLSFRRGNQLQLASQLLYFAPDPDEVLLERFRSLYSGFEEQGLRMNAGDYDEVSILAYLDHEPSRVIERLLEDRERIRESLPAKPSKQEGFTLAAATTFQHLATLDRQSQRIVDAIQASQVLALLQAQQVATTVVASNAAITAATVATM